MTDKQNEEGLRECAHCGSTQIREFDVCYDDGLKHYGVRCTNCPISTAAHGTPEEARAVWNRRVVKESGERSQESEWTNEAPTEDGVYSYYRNNGKYGLAVVRNHYINFGLHRIHVNEFTNEMFPEYLYWLKIGEIATPPLLGREGK